MHGQPIKLDALRILEGNRDHMVSIYTQKNGEMWFGVAFEDEHIYATAFGADENKVLKELKGGLSSDASVQFLRRDMFAEKVIKTLKNIYDGKEASQIFDFDTGRLTSYAKKVIGAVCQIPAGYVTSYGGVAKAVGGGPRAVGHVMATNPFAPLCPCHRVVTSSFTLGGYGGGLNMKHAFLERERRGYSSKKTINIEGEKMVLFPVECVLERLEKNKK